MSDKIIYICGFMGAGKSFCGRDAAYHSGKSYLDLDDYIVRRENKPITKIFEDGGEAAFREAEFSALKFAEAELISLGGGAVTYEKSLNFIKENGFLIFLDIDFPTCYERITQNGKASRPNAAARTEEELLELFTKRHEIYSAAADSVARSPEEFTEILEKVGFYN
ncbi:shikimate kinase [Clostridia bacterium]|nr:shikimate kinase [Clostridia bacterium]